MHPGQINNRIYCPRFTCGCAVTGRGRKILPVSHYGLSHTAATDEPAMRTVVGTCVKFLFSSPSPQPRIHSRATPSCPVKILVTVMLRVQQKEFEMIYARLCFVKSIITKLAVGEKIYNNIPGRSQWTGKESEWRGCVRDEKVIASSYCILPVWL